MIEVTQHYSRLGGIDIAPGVYPDGDAGLCGLGDFLIETGRARVIVVDTPVIEAQPVTEAEPAQVVKPSARKSKGGA